MCYRIVMRTTLELDDDLHATAKELAEKKGVTLGQMISGLARQSLAVKAPPKMRNGLLLCEPIPGAPKHGMELVNMLRDEEE